MKKLLALVLCVMMFVAIIPTAAFADDALPGNATAKAWPALSASKTAVDNAKKNLDSIYGSLAANNAVFGAVKSIDTFITDLSKGILADVDTYKAGGIVLSHDTLVDNAKAYLRGIIGNSINKDMNDHLSDFASVSKAKDENGNVLISFQKGINDVVFQKIGSTDATGAKTLVAGMTKADGTTPITLADIPDSAANSTIYIGRAKNAGKDVIYGQGADGHWWYFDDNTDRWVAFNAAAEAQVAYIPEYHYDPIKYADAFATAASKAFTSEKAAKGLESVIYNLYVLKALDKAVDDMDDFYTDVKNWDKDNEILAAYGFNGTTLPGLFDPYVFINPTDLPKDVKLDASLFVPGDLDWAWPVA